MAEIVIEGLDAAQVESALHAMTIGAVADLEAWENSKPLQRPDIVVEVDKRIKSYMITQYREQIMASVVAEDRRPKDFEKRRDAVVTAMLVISENAGIFKGERKGVQGSNGRYTFTRKASLKTPKGSIKIEHSKEIKG